MKGKCGSVVSIMMETGSGSPKLAKVNVASPFTPARKPARAKVVVVSTRDAQLSYVGRPPLRPEPYPPIPSIILKLVANLAFFQRPIPR